MAGCQVCHRSFHPLLLSRGSEPEEAWVRLCAAGCLLPAWHGCRRHTQHQGTVVRHPQGLGDQQRAHLGQVGSRGEEVVNHRLPCARRAHASDGPLSIAMGPPVADAETHLSAEQEQALAAAVLPAVAAAAGGGGGTRGEVGLAASAGVKVTRNQGDPNGRCRYAVAGQTLKPALVGVRCLLPPALGGAEVADC